MEHSIPQKGKSKAPLSDARARRSREALRAALLGLLEKAPLEQITIRDICAVSAVGYTTYFRHYPSKDALLDDLAAEEIGRLVDLSLPVRDSVDSRAAWLAVCAYVHERRTLWSALLTGGAAGAVREEFIRLAREVAKTRLEPAAWLPAELAILLSISTMLEILAWWLRQAEPCPAEQIAEILDRVAAGVGG
jgi:AcrR family transcriptional regulator